MFYDCHIALFKNEAQKFKITYKTNNRGQIYFKNERINTHQLTHFSMCFEVTEVYVFANAVQIYMYVVVDMDGLSKLKQGKLFYIIWEKHVYYKCRFLFVLSKIIDCFLSTPYRNQLLRLLNWRSKEINQRLNSRRFFFFLTSSFFLG